MKREDEEGIDVDVPVVDYSEQNKGETQQSDKLEEQGEQGEQEGDAEVQESKDDEGNNEEDDKDGDDKDGEKDDEKDDGDNAIDPEELADLQDEAGEHERNYEEYDEDNIYSMRAHKEQNAGNQTKKKNIRKAPKDRTVSREQSSEPIGYNPEEEETQHPEDEFANEDPASRKRRLLEEKMTAAIKSKGTRRKKADEDDLERMQDDRIDFLKDKMIKAANIDAEKNLQGQAATEKLKLLDEVVSVLSKADLAISILDNNLLEAVRLWLEPLPDASMPAYQIQKELIGALVDLPIKTDHLSASGIGKVLVFYQRSKRTELNLKKIVDKLIGDWTRPILNKSDSYKDRTIQFQQYNKNKYVNKLSTDKPKIKEAKSLYEETAERRNRAAIPAARTTAYKIAPKVDPEVLQRRRQYANSNNSDERFKKINQRINFKKKTTKKGGPSIEGRNLAI